VRTDWEHVDRAGNKVRRLYSKTQRQKAKSGGIAKWFWLATNPVKDIAHRLITGQGGELEVPGDVSKAFETHMKSERREVVKHSRTGQETPLWITRNRQNHLWDCLVYQVGCSLVFELFETD
jgi:hypothetical protein